MVVVDETAQAIAELAVVVAEEKMVHQYQVLKTSLSAYHLWKPDQQVELCLADLRVVL